MPSRTRRLLGRVVRSYLVFAVVGLLLGAAVAPAATDVVTREGDVAVVPIDGTITGESADDVTARLEAARTNPDVKAVVLVVNSGGGSASASEQLYMAVNRTAETMPVVASVDGGAASGAYYAAAPADAIFVKPSSTVGSIGVLATTPADVEPVDVITTTGPNKLSTADEREFAYLVDSLGTGFVNAVVAARGDRLNLTREEVREARIYGGAQAVQVGLADHVGSRGDAVRHAADLADLDRYEVRAAAPRGDVYFLSRANYLASGAPAENKTMVGPSYLVGDESGAPSVLMVPASYLAADEGNATTVTSNGTATPENATPDATPAEVTHVA